MSASVSSTRSATEEDHPLPDPSWCRNLAHEHSPDLLVVVDPDLRVVWSNAAVTRLLGYELGVLWGSPVFDFVHSEDHEHVLGGLSEAYRRDGYHLATRMRLRRASGTWVDVRVTATTVEIEGRTWFILSVRAVEDEHAIEDRRRRLKALAQSFYVECAAMRWQDEADKSEWLLGNLAAVLGADSVELGQVDESKSSFRVRVGWSRNPTDLVHGGRDSVSTLDASVEELRDAPCVLSLRGETTVVDVGLSARAGVDGAVSIGFTPLPEHWDDANADVVGLMCATLLATVDRCDRERQLAHAASRDALTGLLNRSALHDGLAKVLSDRRMTAAAPVVLFADLNNFKKLNDTYGHREGDKVLVAVARALSEATRATDLAARIGGDEFVVVSVANLESLDALVGRVRGSVERAIARWEGVGVAIGAIALGAEDRPDDVLQRADAAMYTDKRRQRSGREDDPNRTTTSVDQAVGEIRQQRLAEAMLHSVDVVLVLDDEARLMLATPAAYAVFGFDPDVVQGANMLDLVHPDDRDLAVGAFGTALGTPGRNEPVHLRVRDAFGRWRPVEAVATNQIDNPNIQGLVITVRDHTELSARTEVWGV